ncbi:MAG: hypothetical protein ACJ71W_16575 [Terriglobales bacterium]
MKTSVDRSTPAVSQTTFKHGICRYCKCRSNKCRTPEGQKAWRLCVWLDKEHTRCSGSPCVRKWEDEQSALAAQKQTKERERSLRAFDISRRAALGLTRAFGSKSQGDVPAIDAVIMGRLSATLNSIDDALHTACFQRGLLPRIIGDSLRMACFLSQVLPMARAAQVDTGVPASILIAEAYHISGSYFYGGSLRLDRNDIFETGKSFDSLNEAFAARAESLSHDRAFKAIMRATGDVRIGLTSPEYPSNFISLIASWSKEKYGADLVSTIVSNELLACDRLVPVV